MTAAGTQLGPLREHIGRAALEALSDRDLLARFAESHDHEAFAVLVQRHGSGVLSHCRRLLGDPSAADDAFQATFLMLARKARQLRRPEALRAWLFGVTRRIALRTRRRLARSHVPLIDTAAATRDPLAEISARELLHILDDEIARLPERIRLPLLLCAVEGRSVSEAARALDATSSAIKGRLERGRARLRRRLAARGLALPAVLTSLLAESRHPVSAALIESTVAAAASGRVSPAIAALAGQAGTSRIQFRSLFAAVLMLGAGIGTMWILKPPVARELPAPKSSDVSRPDESLPAGAIRRFGTLQLRGCRGPLAFSPDGKFIAVAGHEAADHAIVFDTKTGREVKSFHTRTTIGQLAFTPDGKRLVTIGNGYDANCIWDFESGKLLGRFRGKSVAITADGKYLKAAEAHEQKTIVMTIRLTGETVSQIELPVDNDRAFCLSPLGSFAVGSVENPAGNVAVFDLVNGAVAKRLTIPRGPIVGAAFDAAERLLIACGNQGFTVWEWKSGKETFKWSGRVYGTPVFSHDGKQIAWAGDNAIWVADPLGGKPNRLAPMTPHWYAPPEFSPDGKRVAFVTDGGAVQILDAKTSRDLVPLPAMTGRVWNVAFTSDRRQIIARDMLHTCIWDAESGRLLHRLADDLPEGEKPVANTIDANQIVTFRQDDASVRLRDLTTLREIRRLDAPLKPYDIKYGDLYRNGAVTPDGKFAVLEGITNLVCAFDLTTGKLLSQHPLAGHAMRYRWFNGGRFLAIEREDYEKPLVLDPRTGKQLAESQWSSTWVSQGGRWPEFGDKAIAKLRKLNLRDVNGEPVFGAEAGFVTEVTESANGRYLAVFGRTGQPNVIDERNTPTFWLFDLSTRRQLGYAKLSVGEYFKQFSRDSRLFITTTLQGTIHVREAATGRERLHFAGHLPGEITSLAFSRDGRVLLSGGADTQVFLWDLVGRPTKTDRSPRDLWNALASDNATEAQSAMSSLIANPKEAVEIIARGLKPGATPEARQLAQWCTQLGDADFATRERATAELAKAGEFAVPELRKELTGSSLEQRRRAERLLRDLEANALTGERLRAVRAIEVLERIGSPEAKQLLAELAKRPECLRLAREAKESLRRFGD